MNIRCLDSGKPSRILASFLSIIAILAIALPGSGGVSAQEPSVYVRAHPVWDSVDAWSWPQDATLHLAIDDPATVELTDFAMDMPGTVDPNLGSVWFDFAGAYDLKPGDIVTVTDGANTRSLVVSILSIDAVDLQADTVSGTGEPGAQVRLPIPGDELFVTAGDDGQWDADFTQKGFDLTAGMMVIAEFFDEDGDNSSFELWIPSPWLTAFPEWDFVEGFEWPVGSPVHLAIDDPGTEPAPDVEGDDTAEPSPWGDPRTYVSYEFAGAYDLKPGDAVTGSDGVTDRTFVVRILSITSVDVDADTITGTAEPGAIVNVWPHETGEQIAVTADDSGVWVADLAGAYDIVVGSGGRAEIRDDLYNGTAVDWYVYNPHFTVFPEWEWYDGLDWPDGVPVNISVQGKEDACNTSGVSQDHFFNGGFPAGCDIQVGDTVTFTDGETTRTHMVQSLAITKVNQEDDIVKGTAGAGAEIHVWPHATGQELLATANPKGKWEVDFTGMYGLVTGDGGGRAQIVDEQGNGTAVDWNIPSPRLIAFPEVDEIYGFYWPEGSIVNLSINDTHVAQATAQGAPWDPNEILALFNFGGLHDLAAGDELLLSGHDLEIHYTVQDLGVTAVNEAANIVTGTAAPGAKIMVYPFEFGDQPLFAIADENGDWFADFGEAGIDLVPGMCGRSDIFDEFANSTTVDWCLPGPERIIVHVVDDWFRAGSFPPDTSLHFAIYDAPDGNLLLESETAPTDANGEVTTWMGNQLQIEPGQYIVVSDGSTTKSLVLEPLTFDVFNLSTGYLQGTLPEPFGRIVSVGIGCWDREDLTMHVFSDESGIWVADFEAEIPNEFGCAFAWTYDGDGDVSEARPPAP